MKRTSLVLTALVSLLISLQAQNVSSSVRAVIVDQTNATIPGAECNLVNRATQSVVTVSSDSRGECVFLGVQAGSYDLQVKLAGFKSLESPNIEVTAAQTRTLGMLSMEVGGMTESVTVEDEVAQIQLATAEKSGTITTTQLHNIAVKGRDFFALMNTVPGVVDTFSQRRKTSSPDSIRGTFINGQRENQKNVAVDGITNLDTGSNSSIHFQPNMDSIAEIKVLTSNYQAEFGRNGGGVITVITRSGGRDFHGSGYWFYRHESMNANSFFNNRNNVAKNPYRYRINGFTVGGPVFIPGKFNKNRDKLFFFVSQEYVGMKKDYGQQFANMPTALERNGDYSQSFDAAGKLIPVKDPLTGKNFANNMIPSARFNELGQNILNFFPLPNWVDPDPKQFYNRNYRSAYSGSYPKRQDMIRLDSNITDTLSVYYRYIKDKDEQDTPWGLWVNGSLNSDLTPTVFGQPGKGHNFHLTKTFSPTFINEFIFGKSRNSLYFYPLEPEKISRSLIGNPKEWYADSSSGVTYVDQADYMPNLQFGGNPNPVYVSFGNIPYENYNNIWSVVNNVNKISGSHNVKAGVYLERTQKFQVGGGNWRGHFNCARNANNPLDSNHSFSNALLGVFNTYQEANARVNGDWWFWSFEFYLQDNWKVNRRLTIDAGLRVYHLPPQIDKNDTIASFDPFAFNVSAAPALYLPAKNAQGKRVAMDPLTGTLAPSPLIGQFVPGSGNFANGAFVGGEDGYPQGLYSTPYFSYGPRFGFAYDLFGNGKTGLRGGVGVFQDRMQGNPTMNTNGNPPVAFTPTLFFDSLGTYASAPGARGPTNINMLFGEQKPAMTMNYSFSIQHQIADWAVDVGYVGGISRHLLAQLNLNPIPMFARFVDVNPQNADPTNKKVALADNFLRPYTGWGDLNYRNAGYNSLQISLNKRYSSGL